MANPYPANFETLQGSRRATGQVNFTDPANQPGSTYAPPTAREQISGLHVNIADGSLGALTWDAVVSGSALLADLGDSQPSIVTAGIYAVTVWVDCPNGLTAGGSYVVTLHLDRGGDDASVQQTSGTATVAVPEPEVTVSMTYYIPAGGTLQVAVTNHDGAAAQDFALSAGIVQRLT